VPTSEEIAENPRAASARLRAVERIKARRTA
jgi:16S rRNA (cytosine1402-N4)-methyltransferase